MYRALADIGSAEAREALEPIAKNDDPQITACAKKRLDHWAQEIARKGTAAKICIAHLKCPCLSEQPPRVVTPDNDSSSGSEFVERSLNT